MESIRSWSDAAGVTAASESSHPCSHPATAAPDTLLQQGPVLTAPPDPRLPRNTPGHSHKQLQAGGQALSSSHGLLNQQLGLAFR